jgi:tripartite-type tricarboxylate transporter receptor subunit TctC
MRSIAGAAGISITTIPYSGAGQANPALFSGEIDLTYMGIGNALQHIEAGRLHPIVLTGRQRVEALPGVPTMAEVGADVGLPNYMAAYGPAGIPEPVLNRLYEAIVSAARTPQAQGFYRSYTMTFVGDRPAEFAEFARRDRAQAAQVFQAMSFVRGAQ